MAAKPEQDCKTAAALIRAGSLIEGVESAGKDFLVWTTQGPAVKKDPDLLFSLCRVLPGSTQQTLKLQQVEPTADSQELTVQAKEVWQANPGIDPLTYGDIGGLPHTNEPCVLDFLARRYQSKVIYTTAEPLIVAVNPFQDLKNAGPDTIALYRDAPDVDKLPPHVFYASRRAMTNMHQLKKPQTIIVSGESGAGKTETTKMLMKYLATSAGGNLDLKIQTAIMAANPVLEAFGNAKTVRNNNSSRFGRFMLLDVAREGGIQHGKVVAFLLEKSRIVCQDKDERSYHIFYQFLKGAPGHMRQRYMLQPLEAYTFINPHCLDAPGIVDTEDFEQTVKSLESMNMTETETCTIWSIVSGVLLMGNAKPTGKTEAGVENAACFVGESEAALRNACSLLFLDYPSILHELTVKTTYAGSNKIESRWTVPDSEMLRASLAKGMYEQLFLWIIRKLNADIEPKGGSFDVFMGLLDIFGFEVFQNNSLEQLFINITNEVLQRNFTDIVFEKELQLYSKEGISSKKIEYTTNEKLIETLLGKGTSVLAALEDQCISPSGTDEKFVSSLASKLAGNKCFIPSKNTKSLEFTVVHTIGKVIYNADGFAFKNKDVLRPEIIEITRASTNDVVRGLFEGVKVEKGKMAKGMLIGSQFMTQLKGLMEVIQKTESHFIRCIKPNDDKVPLKWVNSKVLIQLHALSILEALHLRQLAFSYRRTFEEFAAQFRFINLGVSNKPGADAKTICVELLKSTSISADEYALGKTMVFLKPQAAKMLVRLQREALSAWEPLVGVFEGMTVLKRAKQLSTGRAVPATRICANVRRKLVQAGIKVC
ncbi:myosin D [Toxoplasma gondii ME49]|uniref:Myosin D n=15 Tax=Toxoplasma gondii TaxID=5811 RepID=B6KC84_TOXGV|nr:myosin D [Toxoplasma gondii ME49]EPR62459.1 myosin D [Toxoplasma gondii GT1]ESS31848.1 myosin D [Toxoplasma gondii VEG]KAF4640976.1 myosin D [Toxoplasma gondii]KFG30910.1 myosin D [Toxoplasma gondii GAB2-2007-GAL-DOM2]KFH04528.1 myosin D [Toxoplasma gondii MAS]KFH10307.1 myosin D [Toxoplasma gondii VAND]KYF40753.1 myosin D [Toxoplasma gondii ARI]PIM05528.1 myosin D [Toxoplasma gondii COUG]RQX71533.1 myosin D [Toxoplasma gondii CAST]|eukprot:XP_002365418.1 myosin D [Toxoplasma gondii ME49]